MAVNNVVPIADLRCLCDPSTFDFDTTADIEPLDQVIGQERAVRAITFGLEMKSAGYHIFVTGPEGTGKTTIVQEIVSKAAKLLPTPPDWCMVNNFKDSYRPRALPLPPGQAARFAKRIDRVHSHKDVRIVECVRQRGDGFICGVPRPLQVHGRMSANMPVVILQRTASRGYGVRRILPGFGKFRDLPVAL